MRWILGLDTRHLSQGALHFAVWMARQMKRRDVEIVPIHVLEHDMMMMRLRRQHLQEVLDEAQAAAQDAINEAGAADVVADVEVVQAMTADAYLADAVRLHGADGVIIGRAAAADSEALIRLGRVARRLTRELPATVVVVPPSLVAADLGDGPIACAIDPTPESRDAALSALDFAKGVERDTVFLNTAPHVSTSLRSNTPDPELVAVSRKLAKEKLSRYCETHGLGPAEQEVLYGPVPDVVLGRAGQLRSPLIACGSRRLSLAQRVFASSFGTDLARNAATPVMIVPPR